MISAMITYDLGRFLQTVDVNLMISACARGRAWREAILMLDWLEKAEINAEIAGGIAGTSAPNRTSAQMAIDGARLRPTVRSYGAALSALHKGGQWREAVRRLQRMRQLGPAPSRECYAPVLLACKEAGEWRTAIEVWTDMLRSAPEARRDVARLDEMWRDWTRFGEIACDQTWKWTNQGPATSRPEDPLTRWQVRPDAVCVRALLDGALGAGEYRAGLGVLAQFAEISAEMSGAPKRYSGVLYTQATTTTTTTRGQRQHNHDGSNASSKNSISSSGSRLGATRRAAPRAGGGRGCCGGSGGWDSRDGGGGEGGGGCGARRGGGAAGGGGLGAVGGRWMARPDKGAHKLHATITMTHDEFLSAATTQYISKLTRRDGLRGPYEDRR